ncbi:MAG: c-type cytochrome [Legionellaceae bacterium]|nr:c-type cytochrome [Legionellaceae bacterium]
MLSPSLFASNNAHGENTSLPLIDGYYPAYPETKAGTPEEEELIQRGEYLAKMGDCISCHTNVKGNTPAYAGGLSIATPFGTFYSPNITPDKETGIGGWTEQNFIQALKHGRDPSGSNYFPVFPFVYFANVTDEDARALYAYFMSIPPVKQKNKALPFPFNVPGARFTLWGWDLLFFYPNTLFKEDPKQSAAWNRGKYIVDGLGHCSMCHTPLNPLGSPKARNYLTGGFVDGYWAPNITKLGLADATPEEIANIFVSNQLLNKSPVAGPMAEVNHNSLKYLTESDRVAIGVYLKTVESEEPLGLPPSDAPPTLSRGKQVYLSSCIICHQNGEMAAPIIGNGPNWYRRLKTSGLAGLYKNVLDGYNSMPIKGACVTCSDNDVIAAVDYILNQSLSRSERLDLAAYGAKKFPTRGKRLYDEHCSVCHSTGKSGAPVIGDKKAWQPLIKKNIDVLVTNTINGDKHPKQGGCAECSTGEIMDAIKYMVNQSKTDGDYSLW